MKVEWVRYIPVYERIVKYLEAGESVIITTPRFTACEDVLAGVENKFQESITCLSVVLGHIVQAGRLDYKALSEVVAKGLSVVVPPGLRRRGQGALHKRIMLGEMLLKSLESRNKPTMLLLDSSSRIDDEELYGLLMCLDYVADNASRKDVNFRFLAINELGVGLVLTCKIKGLRA